MDQNRYEDVPKKENPAAKAFKSFGHYLKYVFVDFFNSFKYNNMKLAGLLIIIPGAIFGFFLHFHALTIRDVNLSATDQKNLNGLFDYSGLALFALMLVCILTIFAGFTLMNKKNKGSVIIVMITTIIIIGFGAAYIYLLMLYFNSGNQFYDAVERVCMEKYGRAAAACSDEEVNAVRALLADKESGYYIYAITASKRPVIDGNWVMSVGSIIFCIASSVVGVILGFIKYDRTYERGRDR